MRIIPPQLYPLTVPALEFPIRPVFPRMKSLRRRKSHSSSLTGYASCGHMPRPTDYRNPETNMHGTLKYTITRFRKPIPVFPSGQKTHAARDGNGSAARNAKRQFFRCSDGTEERFSGRLRAAYPNARRTVPHSRPYAAERMEKPCRRSKRRQRPAMHGRPNPAGKTRNQTD